MTQGSSERRTRRRRGRGQGKATTGADREAALKSEARALKKALVDVQAKLAAAEASHTRAIGRMTRAFEREREALEAQLTKLVEEVGQLRHMAERAERLEIEIRARTVATGVSAADLAQNAN